jgi:hypothetical protein
MPSSQCTRRRFVSFLAAPALVQPPAPPRLRRAESFFGLHFDLHPNQNDTVLGRDVTPEAVGLLVQPGLTGQWKYRRPCAPQPISGTGKNSPVFEIPAVARDPAARGSFKNPRKKSGRHKRFMRHSIQPGNSWF